MDALVATYDREAMSAFSLDRRRTVSRTLADFLSRTADRAYADALRSLLHALRESGYADGTLRKTRAVVLSFASWAWREGHISATELLELRDVRLIGSGTGELSHRPYRPGEVRELRLILRKRWPKLCPDDARRWMERYSDGRSPYSRIRSHVMRCQIEAVIALALHLGLRRREIYALDVASAHPDNAYVVVGDCSPDLPCRTVPYPDSARLVMQAWLACHRFIARGSPSLWLTTHAASTVTHPMTRETFHRILATHVGPGWTLKRLRDTCAVAWLRAGLALTDVRELLGLASMSAVLPYARLVGGIWRVAWASLTTPSASSWVRSRSPTGRS